jgi:hypothetical protein
LFCTKFEKKQEKLLPLFINVKIITFIKPETSTKEKVFISQPNQDPEKLLNWKHLQIEKKKFPIVKQKLTRKTFPSQVVEEQKKQTPVSLSTNIWAVEIVRPV